MDKFVQLPFIIPPSSSLELSGYLDSLFAQEAGPTQVGVEVKDRAARIIEQKEGSPQTIEQVANQVA